MKLLVFHGFTLAYANGGMSVCRIINPTIFFAGMAGLIVAIERQAGIFAKMLNSDREGVFYDKLRREKMHKRWNLPI
ncbi:MAG TPA: hypothetical protein ENI97_06195 [Gammaproteobacteria bacterium]|nr:hypothetical protein [Gammaproteobacteria bacterium]